MTTRYQRTGYRPYCALNLGAELAAKVDARRFKFRYPKAAAALRDAIIAGLAVLNAGQAGGADDVH